jgi:hypothetical protein
MKRIAAIVVFALLCGIVFAQDLKIDYTLDLSPGATTSYFTFTGPIRYMAVDKDHVDDNLTIVKAANGTIAGRHISW